MKNIKVFFENFLYLMLRFSIYINCKTGSLIAEYSTFCNGRFFYFHLIFLYLGKKFVPSLKLVNGKQNCTKLFL